MQNLEFLNEKPVDALPNRYPEELFSAPNLN